MPLSGAPQTFADDLAAFLAADATVRDLFDGKTFNGEADNDAGLPYLTFVQTDSTSINVIGLAKGVDVFTVQFQVRASDSGATWRAAERLKDVLLPTPAWTPQPFSGPYGREVGRYTNGPDSNELDPERAPYNGDCWCYTFPVVFTIARG